MTTDELPEDVVELLHERLHSFEAVEALLLLHAQPGAMRVRELADRLSVDREVVRAALEELSKGGFVEQEAASLWRYAPTDSATRAAVDSLVRVYGAARLVVMRRMTQNSMERIRSSAAAAFADAFRLAKGRKDG